VTRYKCIGLGTEAQELIVLSHRYTIQRSKS
jgi:hypothetical protein